MITTQPSIEESLNRKHEERAALVAGWKAGDRVKVKDPREPLKFHPGTVTDPRNGWCVVQIDGGASIKVTNERLRKGK